MHGWRAERKENQTYKKRPHQNEDVQGRKLYQEAHHGQKTGEVKTMIMMIAKVLIVLTSVLSGNVRAEEQYGR